jgi:hypothetical protein
VRRAAQLLPIHLVDFHLDPKHVYQAFSMSEKITEFKFIKMHTSSEHIRTHRDSLNFKRMREGFESSELWEHEVAYDAYTFW